MVNKWPRHKRIITLTYKIRRKVCAEGAKNFDTLLLHSTFGSGHRTQEASGKMKMASHVWHKEIGKFTQGIREVIEGETGKKQLMGKRLKVKGAR